VVITSPTAAIASFPGLAGQTYSFKLTVTNTDGLSASATTTVKIQAATPVSITTFTASPSSITAGASSTLVWVVLNATTVTISPNVGNVNPSSGSVQVTPSATTSYTLTATNATTGTVTATTTVTVNAATVPNPQIVMFNGSPLSITAGQMSTLSWTTVNATSVTISGLGAQQQLSGSVSTPALTTTTTYTLTATGANGNSVTAVITIQVVPVSIPQVVVFTASPQTINAGQSSTLCWQVTGTTGVNISNGVGSNLNPNTCATVSPQTTTTYTLTASNSAGQITASVTVNVGSTQILQFSANPVFSGVEGAPVVLTWQTTNATSVALVGGDIQSSPANLPVNGSFTVNPTANVTYTLIAYGPGGASVSAVISVSVR